MLTSLDDIRKQWEREGADAALRSCCELIDFDRDTLDLHLLMGEIFLSINAQKSALTAYETALAFKNEEKEAWLHCRVGDILLDMKRYEPALVAFSRALAADETCAHALVGMGIVLEAEGQQDEAMESYAMAYAVDPSYHQAALNMGHLFRRKKHMEDALKAYGAVLDADPSHADASRCYAGMINHLFETGDKGLARQYAEQWYSANPSNPFIAHLAPVCLDNVDRPERASPQYVEQLFDSYAPVFEATLEGLKYRGNRLFSQFLRNVAGMPTGHWRVLDAGCGTGVCADFLRIYADELTGVDISAAMLRESQKKNIYTSLIKEDILPFLERQKRRYDLILAADLCCYFGDLLPLFKAARESLSAQGRFLFSIERLPDKKEGDVMLGLSGRYAHKKDHIMTLLEEVGLNIENIKEERCFRREYGRCVPAVLFAVTPSA